jgi:enterochelin esterase-like enzyme
LGDGGEPIDQMTRKQALVRAGTAGMALLGTLADLPNALGGLGADVASAAGGATTGPNMAAVPAALESQALRGSLHFVVYLPASYARSARRYPVIYFFHGLPASPTSYLHLGWVAQALAQLRRQAILVVPQATRVDDGDPEYHNWGPGDDWETALAVELPAWMDVHYRTIANRNGRAVAGFSAGGYGATMIGLHHPTTFSVIQSWSGYFRPTDPTGRKTLDLGSAAANAYANVENLVPSLASQFKHYPTSFAFYVGRDDPTFVPDNTLLDSALTAAGIPHLFRLYPGSHTTTLWKSHAPTWLGSALDRLEAATTA